ncbi:MAG TPA: 23S rRNA (adenine(2503)-C(2))-methyltransferase RlmN [Spirochaetia bacterium]|nr:23S rRNA (adenine(2503)-C(2))-methyltransferase RlmN [Spirochaetales bacterium]HRS64278.1 23S rRNA (adenine(2503)-C(2))-methyltransferase RlmN [Spirochaetia bacterium]HRV28853.1 23S rRNA (adenine(2503)-C(2))-methyltransferase RlmN [Spirochaetia bacterium]
MIETYNVPHALVHLFPSELVNELRIDMSFRGKQIFKWISIGAQSFHDMTDLPASLRQSLAERFPSLYTSTVANTFIDKQDGSAKLQIKLYDGTLIESVLLVDTQGRKTACLSTQAGCGMHCAFCKTGTLGFLRNLESYEIIEQYYHLMNNFGKPNNIVFMGMGEPLLNLPNVIKAISIFTAHDGLQISKRKITISTCGIVPGILELAEQHIDVRLAVSLTVADDTIRSQLMPINQTWNLYTLKQALLTYQEKTGERITLELPMLSGINTTPECAYKLVAWIKGLQVQVNLIAWNHVDELPYKTPSSKELTDFITILKQHNINVVQRAKRGRGINGACGQLGRIKQE